MQQLFLKLKELSQPVREIEARLKIIDEILNFNKKQEEFKDFPLTVPYCKLPYIVLLKERQLGEQHFPDGKFEKLLFKCSSGLELTPPYKHKWVPAECKLLYISFEAVPLKFRLFIDERKIFLKKDYSKENNFAELVKEQAEKLKILEEKQEAVKIIRLQIQEQTKLDKIESEKRLLLAKTVQVEATTKIEEKIEESQVKIAEIKREIVHEVALKLPQPIMPSHIENSPVYIELLKKTKQLESEKNLCTQQMREMTASRDSLRQQYDKVLNEIKILEDKIKAKDKLLSQFNFKETSFKISFEQWEIIDSIDPNYRDHSFTGFLKYVQVQLQNLGSEKQKKEDRTLILEKELLDLKNEIIKIKNEHNSELELRKENTAFLEKFSTMIDFKGVEEFGIEFELAKFNEYLLEKNRFNEYKKDKEYLTKMYLGTLSEQRKIIKENQKLKNETIKETQNLSENINRLLKKKLDASKIRILEVDSALQYLVEHSDKIIFAQGQNHFFYFRESVWGSLMSEYFGDKSKIIWNINVLIQRDLEIEKKMFLIINFLSLNNSSKASIFFGNHLCRKHLNKDYRGSVFGDYFNRANDTFFRWRGDETAESQFLQLQNPSEDHIGHQYAELLTHVRSFKSAFFSF
jgi:hypothetical protein